jgi:hypothetical protein
MRPGRFKKKRQKKDAETHLRLTMPDGRVLEAVGAKACMELLKLIGEGN